MRIPELMAATITMDRSHEPAVSRALLSAFPAISIIEIRDVIAKVSGLLRQMAAVVGAGFVPFLAFVVERQVTRRVEREMR